MRTERYTRPDGRDLQPARAGLCRISPTPTISRATSSAIRDHSARVRSHQSIRHSGWRGCAGAPLRIRPALSPDSATGREANNIPQSAARGRTISAAATTPGITAPGSGQRPNLTADYWERYAYDPAGNLISLQHGSNGTAQLDAPFRHGRPHPAQWAAGMAGASEPPANGPTRPETN